VRRGPARHLRHAHLGRPGAACRGRADAPRCAGFRAPGRRAPRRAARPL